MKNEKPTLIIPDVHLKMDRLRNVLDAWGDRGGIVFLGDFFDDFSDTPEANVEMASFLKDRVFSRDDCTVIMGNHDLNYHPKCPPSLRCSGFSREKFLAIGEVFSDKEWRRFCWATNAGDFLLTHAGLHPRMTPAFFTGGAKDLAEWVNLQCRNAVDTMDETEPLLRAGYSRYGNQPTGGVIWMDVREYEPLDGVPQIFGHTPLRSPAKLEDPGGGVPSYCVDTHLCHVAVARGGKIDVFENGPGLTDAFGSLGASGRTRRVPSSRTAGIARKGPGEGRHQGTGGRGG